MLRDDCDGQYLNAMFVLITVQGYGGLYWSRVTKLLLPSASRVAELIRVFHHQ